jgi:hypothetical protein
MELIQALRQYRDVSAVQRSARRAYDESCALDEEWLLESVTLSQCSDSDRSFWSNELEHIREGRPGIVGVGDFWRLWRHDTPLPGMPTIEPVQE